MEERIEGLSSFPDRMDQESNQFAVLRELGTHRRPTIQDRRIWQVSQRLEQIQSAITMLMDGDTDLRNYMPRDNQRNPYRIPISRLPA